MEIKNFQKIVNLEQQSLILLTAFSFIFYVLLNECFAQIALIIAEQRIIILPTLFGIICGNKGFNNKDLVLFIAFIGQRLCFIYGYNSLLRSKYEILSHFLGVYVIADFIRVFLILVPIGINWDVYFYPAFPILHFSRMTGIPSWLCFITTGSLSLFVFYKTQKLNITNLVTYFCLTLLSFIVYVALCYGYTGMFFTAFLD